MCGGSGMVGIGIAGSGTAGRRILFDSTLAGCWKLDVGIAIEFGLLEVRGA